MRKYRSSNYNWDFDEETGYFVRWGSTMDDDPERSPVGPEIADIEISTICHGLGTPCTFCYKSNNHIGKNMSLETFKIIFSKFPENLTQIAFGIGDIDSNPDMFHIFEYCRENGVIPNVTTNGYGVTEEIAERLVSVCGAVAVSRYTPKDVCYDAVKLLTDKGMKQANIHMLVSKETYGDCFELLYDMRHDDRLKNMNAVVFLSLKKQGRGTGFNTVTQDEFGLLVDEALRNKMKFGFDSCSAKKFINSLSKENLKALSTFVEPCESGLFSIYVNVDGMVYPCSFTEFGKGINLLEVNDFLTEVWNSDIMMTWVRKLLYCNRHCPVYEV